MNRIRKFVRTKSSLLLLALCCLGSTLICVVGLYVVAAAPPYVSVQPENGVLSASSATVADTAASGGSAVRFGDGFLSRQGTQLMLDGQKYRFIGVNAYGLATCESGALHYYSNADLDALFRSLPAHSLTRFFATSRATVDDVGYVVARAEANNQMLIVSLIDGANNCNKDNVQLDHAWYQSGYKTYYLPWVDAVVGAFKNSKAIGMWEIANEPGWGCPGDCGVTKEEMKSFMDTAAARIKAIDSRHLVESGAIGKDIAAMKLSGDFAFVQSGPNIDVTSMHEYEYQYNGNQLAGSGFATEKTASDGLNKPMIIGETGAPLSIPTNITCRDPTLTEETLMERKFDSYFSGGAAGVLIWGYMKTQPSWIVSGCSSGNHYFYGPNNPVFSMLRTFPL